MSSSFLSVKAVEPSDLNLNESPTYHTISLSSSDWHQLRGTGTLSSWILFFSKIDPRM